MCAGSAQAFKRGTKRAAEADAGGDADELEDSQKKALMTRKQRKMFEGLRKKEGEKAEKIAGLEAKRDKLKVKKTAA